MQVYFTGVIHWARPWHPRPCAARYSKPALVCRIRGTPSESVPGHGVANGTCFSPSSQLLRRPNCPNAKHTRESRATGTTSHWSSHRHPQGSTRLPLVLGSDGQGISRLQARLHVFRMELLLLPSPCPEGRELKRLLQCPGPNEGILKVINHVVTGMGSRATVSYAPLDVIHSRSAQVQIHSSSQLQLDQNTRATRD